MSNKEITLLDYGMANLLNVSRAFEYLGTSVKIVDDAKDAAHAQRLVVPGVGAFAQVLKEIRKRNFDEAIMNFARSGKPLLGICIGMQMLFDYSEEFGINEGLGIIPGNVKAIPRVTTEKRSQRVPHIGWNNVILPEGKQSWSDCLFEDLDGQSPAYYFVHSFAAEPDRFEDRLADCMYGGRRICAAIQRDNIVATQFHPERSADAGLNLLKKFLLL